VGDEVRASVVLPIRLPEKSVGAATFILSAGRASFCRIRVSTSSVVCDLTHS